jgi:hypothetical protein
MGNRDARNAGRFSVRNLLRKCVPGPVRRMAWKSGIGYAANYLTTYRQFHRSDRFVGNLPRLQETWAREPGEAALIEALFDSIILPNGVRKTTSPGRQLNTLKQFLSRPERPAEGAKLRVLDLPCSNGVGSIDSRSLLSVHYGIDAYVLADLYLELKYDRKRDAVYTSEGELLQVQGSKYFFSIPRAHTSGITHTRLSDLLLWPIAVRAAWLKRKYAVTHLENLETIRLLHPETERCVANGMFTVQNADVFSLPWREEFDLVLSFNLLQRNYFPATQIAKGRENLCQALKEGGYLVTGNTESFGVLRKVKGALVTQYQQGEW